MAKFDVWFYAITVEAEGETEAIAKVNAALDKAMTEAMSHETLAILEDIQVDYAEEI